MMLIESDNGQTAMTDAILFMTLMVIACAVVIGSTGDWGTSLAQRRGLQQYTDDFADTLLSVELADIYYLDGNGDVVDLAGSPRSVGLLLSEEVLLIRNGMPKAGLAQGYERPILDAGRSLSRSGTGFAILCDNDGTQAFISDFVTDSDELPADRSASQRTVSLPGCGTMSITVYTWVLQ